MDEKARCLFVLYGRKGRKKQKKPTTKQEDLLSELKKVNALLDAGVITGEEFAAIKAKLIAGL